MDAYQGFTYSPSKTHSSTLVSIAPLRGKTPSPEKTALSSIIVLTPSQRQVSSSAESDSPSKKIKGNKVGNVLELGMYFPASSFAFFEGKQGVIQVTNYFT